MIDNRYFLHKIRQWEGWNLLALFNITVNRNQPQIVNKFFNTLLTDYEYKKESNRVIKVSVSMNSFFLSSQLLFQSNMTLDLTIEKAQLRLSNKAPNQMKSYVILYAGGKVCHTMISHGLNPVWARQMFRSGSEDKFYFSVCIPTGPFPQPYIDKPFLKGVWDFKTFARTSQIQKIDDTRELQVDIPLASTDNGNIMGSLTIRVRYIVGKIHIGGLHPFSQIDLTFEDVNPSKGINANNIRPITPMAPVVRVERPLQPSPQRPPSSPDYIPPNVSVTVPGTSISPGWQSLPGPNMSGSKFTGGQFSTPPRFGPSIHSPQQTSVEKQPPLQPPQLGFQHPSIRPETGTSYMSGHSIVGLKQPWMLMKSGADKLNIFSILDSTNKPFEVAPGRIHNQYCKSRMRTPIQRS